VEAMMGRFAEWAVRVTGALVPSYMPTLYQERVTFRPVLRGIKQGLHIDSSYGHPTRGQGMLRLFCNIDPAARARVWQVGERFEPFVSRFLPRVRRQDPTLAERVVGGLGLLGGHRTAYDHTIAEIRDVAMHDFEYQKTAPRRILEFPVGSSWLGITDLVVHGAVFGQNSLDQTFFLPDTAMSDPSRSSLRILERLTGRALA
jgi:3-deoxy-D-manno-oct-2-ulosonic acid (Kdo) hydroxylase